MTEERAASRAAQLRVLLPWLAAALLSFGIWKLWPVSRLAVFRLDYPSTGEAFDLRVQEDVWKWASGLDGGSAEAGLRNDPRSQESAGDSSLPQQTSRLDNASAVWMAAPVADAVEGPDQRRPDRADERSLDKPDERFWVQIRGQPGRVECWIRRQIALNRSLPLSRFAEDLEAFVVSHSFKQADMNTGAMPDSALSSTASDWLTRLEKALQQDEGPFAVNEASRTLNDPAWQEALRLSAEGLKQAAALERLAADLASLKAQLQEPPPPPSPEVIEQAFAADEDLSQEQAQLNVELRALQRALLKMDEAVAPVFDALDSDLAFFNKPPPGLPDKLSLAHRVRFEQLQIGLEEKSQRYIELRAAWAALSRKAGQAPDAAPLASVLIIEQELDSTSRQAVFEGERLRLAIKQGLAEFRAFALGNADAEGFHAELVSHLTRWEGDLAQLRALLIDRRPIDLDASQRAAAALDGRVREHSEIVLERLRKRLAVERSERLKAEFARMEGEREAALAALIATTRSLSDRIAELNEALAMWGSSQAADSSGGRSSGMEATSRFADLLQEGRALLAEHLPRSVRDAAVTASGAGRPDAKNAAVESWGVKAECTYDGPDPESEGRRLLMTIGGGVLLLLASMVLRRRALEGC